MPGSASAPPEPVAPSDVDRFAVHGVRIDIASEHPGTRGGLQSRLRRFVAGPADAARPADLTVAIASVGRDAEHAIDRPPGTVRPVYDAPAGDVLYAPAEDVLYIDYLGRVRVSCAPESGSIRMSIRETGSDDWWLAAHPLFTIPFVETMKRRGRFMVHAAGVSRDGRALLLPGESGAGKSTLTLALMRAGFELLGDDTCFLTTIADGLRVLPFADAMNVTSDTAGFFPEVDRAPRLSHEVPRRHGAPKRSVLPEDVYAVRFAAECAPAVLVFPRIAHEPRSVVRAMEPAEALLELTPNVLLTQPRSSQAHLDALAALVGASRCYRLETGRDLDDIPDLLGTLLARAEA